jgi:hypothetical protein
VSCVVTCAAYDERGRVTDALYVAEWRRGRREGFEPEFMFTYQHKNAMRFSEEDAVAAVLLLIGRSYHGRVIGQAAVQQLIVIDFKL